MIDEYLASGFADVDAGEDKSFYFQCLSFIESLPYYQEIKRKSDELLDLRPGLSIIDVGCGLGNDLFRMAELAIPGSRAVGVDASSSMIHEACARHANRDSNIAFLVSDARDLPFNQKMFDRARIDRTLQHIPNPEKAISEIFRILNPGGRAVAYDNDWGTFSISSKDRELTRLVEDEWRYSFTNPWIGRHLKRFYAQNGFTDIELFPSVSLITDFEIADQVYNLRKTTDRLIASSQTTRPAADRWLDDLIVQSQEGTLLCSLTAYLLTGKKP